ncbi:hypothetical protein [Neisseria bergeri]|uniref:hypothetical protein n=1 Tax=Neisseria bergeri TaxID=1906581 RepID=UPI00272AC323|nr:hypothetical protein [Neisseria bergeri]
MLKQEGLYVIEHGERGGAVNLVVGEKTFRIAEFEWFEDALEFALDIADNNPETPVFTA